MHKGLVEYNRRAINFRRAQVENVLPEYFSSSFPKFISLLNRYYEYENENDSTELLNHLFQSRDITEADITLLSYIEEELLLGQNYFEGFPNKRAAANFSSTLFRAKGSKYSIQWFFRSFYNLDPEIIYTKNNVFKLNDPNTKLGVESVKYLTDDKLYQTYALLIKIGVPIKDWRQLFKLFVHPAGMYLGGEVLLLSVVDLALNTNQPFPGVANHYPWGDGKVQASGDAESSALGEQIIYYEQDPTYLISAGNVDEGTAVGVTINAINADDGPVYLYFANLTTNNEDFKNPQSDPSVYIQMESSGLDDTGTQYSRQRIVTGGFGGTEELSQNTTRGWLVTRMTSNGNTFVYHSSNQYDTYDAVNGVTNANNLLTYLQTFQAGDLVIMTTFDEPALNKTVFENELVNEFSAALITNAQSGAWTAQPDPVRCRYQLVSIKGSSEPIHEDVDFPGQTDPMATTLMLESISPYNWKVLENELRYEPQYVFPTVSNMKTINIVSGNATYNEIELLNDLKTEGSELFRIYLFDQPSGGTQLAEKTVIVNDTSITPSGPTYNVQVTNSGFAEGTDLSFKILPSNPLPEDVDWQIIGSDVLGRFPTSSGTATSVNGNLTINVPTTVDDQIQGLVSGVVQIVGQQSGSSAQVSFQMDDAAAGYSIDFVNGDNNIIEGETLSFTVTSTNCLEDVTVTITDDGAPGSVTNRIVSFPSTITGLDANSGNITSATQDVTTSALEFTTEGNQTATITVTGNISGETATAQFTMKDVVLNPPTYQISGDVTLTEPASGTSDHTYSLTTTNLAPGTTLYWEVAGTGNNPTVAEDWSAGYSDNGVTTTIVNGNLRGAVVLPNNSGSFVVRQDSNPALEGNKNFVIKIYNDSGYTDLEFTDPTTRTVTEDVGTVSLPGSISIASTDDQITATEVYAYLRFYSDGTLEKAEEVNDTITTTALADWHAPTGANVGLNYSVYITGTPNAEHVFEFSTDGSNWSAYTPGTAKSLNTNVFFRWEDDQNVGNVNQSLHVAYIQDNLTSTVQDQTSIGITTTIGLPLKTRLANMWLSDESIYASDHGQSLTSTQPLRNDLISRQAFNLDSFITGNRGADGWEFRPFRQWSLNGVNSTSFPAATGGTLNPSSGDEVKGNGINGNRTTATRTLTVKNKTDSRKAAAQLTNFVTIVYANAAADGGTANFVYNLTINGYNLRTSSDVTNPNNYQWSVKRSGLIGGRFGFLQVEIPYSQMSTINATMTFDNDDVATIQEIWMIPGRYDATFVSTQNAGSGSANLCSISGGEKDDLVLAWGMAEEDNGNGIDAEGPSSGDPNISFSNNMTRTMGRAVYRNDYVQSNMFVVTSNGTVTYSLQQNGNNTQTAMMLLKFVGNTVTGDFNPSDPVGSFGKYVPGQGGGDEGTGGSTDATDNPDAPGDVPDFILS